MKKVLCALCAVLMLTVTGCSQNTVGTETASRDALAQKNSGKKAIITVVDFGEIEVQLDSESAPVTVDNFINLADNGFYDGLTFHRIIKGFMIQGGDPLGNGMGGSDTKIQGEFAENGVENPISHVRGTISMARSQSKNSASSQFFIVHEDSQFLDGSYAGFGHVTKGMEVVDAICEKVKSEDDNGTVLPENQPIIESIVITD